MGVYLSTPSVEKVSSDEEGNRVAYGASSMQGWRMSQEDAHNCCIDFDEETSLFAVYDGHGGDEVSTYCSQQLPQFLKNTDAYKRGDIKQALIDTFLGFDASLTTPEVIKVLKAFAKDDQNDSENEEDNVARLRMEASMPIEEVLSKYKTEIEDHIIKKSPHLAYLRDNKDTGEASSSGASSSGITGSSSKRPCVAGSSNACSSSGTGSSSSSGVGSSSSDGSSRRSENNDSNVSSSSQQCELASSSGSQNKIEAPNSSEADQELDSTTSNGDAASASQVDSSADSKPVKAKVSEMPDSSEDANERVSPSKVTNSASVPSEAEVNGETNNVETADSSKSVNDNECSSSCSAVPLENGEAEQLENISSSGFKSNQNKELYKNFINSDSSDSDSDDDNYENTDVSYDDEEDDPDGEDDSAESENDENDELAEDEDVQDIPVDDEEDDDEDEDDEVDIREPNDEPGADSGCTAVVAVLKGNELYVANAGDSRCVLCRNGEAVELSFDHKPEDQIEMDRIVKAGGKVTSDGRVNGGLNLSRALGDHAYKKSKDLPAQEQMISALPDIQTITIDREKDEFMVLACDGIWNSMSSQKVITFVRERINQPDKTLSKICEELFDNCLAPNTLGDGTGCDNMTAIIVKFKSLQLEKEASSTEDAVLENKKRPASPCTENNGDGDTVENNAVDNNKRMKMNEC